MNNLLLIIGLITLGNGKISLDNFKPKKSSKLSLSNSGMKILELSDEDIERSMEVITRSKKYMCKEDRKILTKIESVLDLAKGIKKLSTIEVEEDSSFFRDMDEEDKKNMMIKEILEVFPRKKRKSLEKAIDMKSKIDLFSDLFLPDDFLEEGFSFSSLIDFSNLGSMGNLSILGDLLNSDDTQDDDKYTYE